MTSPPQQPGTVITVAPADAGGGARSDPAPPAELASTAADCERIGAAVIDLPPRPAETLAEAVAAVRERSSLLVRVAALPSEEPTGAVLECGADALRCPLAAPAGFVSELREGAARRGLAVHHEARTPAEVEVFAALEPVGGASPMRGHAVLVFDERGMPGDVHTFSAAVDRLPPGATFSATGVAAASVPVMLMALASGGHLRVGLADAVEYAAGTAARDDAQLVARAAGLAKIARRPPLAPAGARATGIGS